MALSTMQKSPNAVVELKFTSLPPIRKNAPIAPSNVPAILFQDNVSLLIKLDRRTTKIGVIIMSKEPLMGVVNDNPLKNIN